MYFVASNPLLRYLRELLWPNPPPHPAPSQHPWLKHFASSRLRFSLFLFVSSVLFCGQSSVSFSCASISWPQIPIFVLFVSFRDRIPPHPEPRWLSTFASSRLRCSIPPFAPPRAVL